MLKYLLKIHFCIIFIVSFFVTNLQARDVQLKTNNTLISVNEKGYYSSIQVNSNEILQKGKQFPIVLAGNKGQIVLPVQMKAVGHLLKLVMSDGNKIDLRVKESDECVRLEAYSVASQYDMVLFGPIGVNVNEVVGEVVGVAQGGDIAFGVQALNIKTTAGIPDGYVSQVLDKLQYKGERASLSVSSVPDYKQAATKTADGAVFQLAARRRDLKEYRKVNQAKEALVLPVEGSDGVIKGAAIALFGCKRADALERIGKIEQSEGLPHPMLKGEWAKMSRESMKSYLITDFGESTLDEVLKKAQLAGFDYIYHDGPFDDWGHFNWDPKFTTKGDAGVKAMVDKAKALGIGVGVHTLSNFMTTNDAYVTPVPTKHLLKQGILTLTSSIDANESELTIKKSDLFSLPMALNGLQIEDELISYGSVEEQGDVMVLKGCKRGAWGTTAAAHSAKAPLYKLWDHGYKVFFPDLKLQDAFSTRITEILNKTGVCQISFDGLEGCSFTGQDEYAMSRFVTNIYDKVQHLLRNDASRLSHNTWHIHTYTNWGEPWGEAMRTGQVESRIKNQAFYRRNLFPRMLGWFLIRLADRRQECSSLEDLEWAMSEAAGFDAGYGMTIRTKTLRRHGQIDLLLKAIHDWDYLREKQVFTEEQKARLRDPKTEWHLEKVNENNFNLYPLFISKSYICNLGEMQPGQPGGSDWSWSTPYEGAYAIRLKVEGDGKIKNPKFTSEKGVIVFPCEVSERQYLLYTFDGKAVVTDKNYNVIQEVVPQGVATIAKGSSAVSFTCELASEDAPDVIIRYITKGQAEKIVVP